MLVCYTVDASGAAPSVGDKNSRKKCLDKVNSIIEKENVTLLFVTHSIGLSENSATGEWLWSRAR